MDGYLHPHPAPSCFPCPQGSPASRYRPHPGHSHTQGRPGRVGALILCGLTDGTPCSGLFRILLYLVWLPPPVQHGSPLLPVPWSPRRGEGQSHHPASFGLPAGGEEPWASHALTCPWPLQTLLHLLNLPPCPRRPLRLSLASDHFPVALQNTWVSHSSEQQQQQNISRSLATPLEPHSRLSSALNSNGSCPCLFSSSWILTQRERYAVHPPNHWTTDQRTLPSSATLPLKLGCGHITHPGGLSTLGIPSAGPCWTLAPKPGISPCSQPSAFFSSSPNVLCSTPDLQHSGLLRLLPNV